MRSVSYSQIMFEAAQIMGLDRSALTTKDFQMIRDLAAARLVSAWNRFDWPNTLIVTPVSPGIPVDNFLVISGVPYFDIRADISDKVGAGTGKTKYDHFKFFNLSPFLPAASVIEDVDYTAWYGSGSNNWLYTPVSGIAYRFGGGFYTTIADTSLSLRRDVEKYWFKNLSWFSDDYWATDYFGDTCQPYIRFIDTDEPLSIGLEWQSYPAPLNRVIGLYDRDPRRSSKAKPVDYGLGDGQLVLTPKNGDGNYWMTYQYECPKLFGDPYSPSVAYSKGNQLYYDAHSNSGNVVPATGSVCDGNFYEALVDVGAGTDPEDTQYFKKIEVPQTFARYIPRAVLADFLRAEQQFDQANAAEADAEAFLDLEFDRAARQEGQVSKLNMAFTY